jgi:hypothetical protein
MEHSGNSAHEGVPAEMSEELERWNWGAFGLTWVWGIANRTPVAWFVLVPYAGWFGMPFLLGLKGTAWAWHNGNWSDIETFRRAQRMWARRALALWLSVLVASAIIAPLLASRAQDHVREVPHAPLQP